jgi:hypothetical protein
LSVIGRPAPEAGRRSQSHAPLDFERFARHSPDLGFVAATAARIALPVWFAIIAVDRIVTFVAHGWVGVDVRIYREAATVALAGGNPWDVLPSGAYFAAPPPTLLFYLPAALVPLPIAVAGWTVVGIASGLFCIRRLGLPLWWLLFPPLVEAIVVGNPDPAVLAFLLLSSPAAGLGAALKTYGAIPLVVERRWRALAVAAAIVVVSAPLWGLFLAARETVAHSLASQAVGLSGWGTFLIVPAMGALVILRDRGAEWLAVPALWPFTQGHYAVMAMPALRASRLGAAVMALSIPLAPVAAVVLMASEEMVRTRRGHKVLATFRKGTFVPFGAKERRLERTN